MSSETFEQTFQVAEPARLKLSNIRGSVEIQAGESGTISVQATKHNGGDKHTTIEMSQAEDGTVVVETREPEGGWRWLGFSSPAKVDYKVSVPAACNLSVSCISSSLSVQGIGGEFSFRTVSGGVDLQQLNGPFKINSVSGDIRGAGLSGTVELETVSGDVRMNESDLSSVRGTTVSGDLHLQTALGDGPYKIRSVSGDVFFFVPADTACTVEIRAVSGKIASTLPLTSHVRRGGSSTAVIQGGGVEVKLNSVSGDLWVGQPGDEPGKAGSVAVPHYEPPEPPEPPDPPAPQPKRLTTAEILALVERGEMSVDEAIRRMQG